MAIKKTVVWSDDKGNTYENREEAQQAVAKDILEELVNKTAKGHGKLTSESREVMVQVLTKYRAEYQKALEQLAQAVGRAPRRRGAGRRG